MRPVRWAVGYSIASLFIGPSVYILGYILFTRGGNDFCDSSYHLPLGSPGSERTRYSGTLDTVRYADSEHAALFQVIGAGMMLVLGAGVLYLLARDAARPGRAGIALSAALPVAMMTVGYVVLILISGAGGQTC